jgi:hypothetical protein
MISQVQKTMDGHGRTTTVFIIHNGLAYVDKLKTVEQMQLQHTTMIVFHDTWGRKEGCPLKRAWHWGLRDNAQRRREMWR